MGHIYTPVQVLCLLLDITFPQTVLCYNLVKCVTPDPTQRPDCSKPDPVSTVPFSKLFETRIGVGPCLSKCIYAEHADILPFYIY